MRTWQAWVHALLCLVIAACVAALTVHFGFTSDWSHARRASITPQSRTLLTGLHGPLDVTAYARPGELRAAIRSLVERYARFKPDLRLKFVDPDLDPAATQDADVTTNGELLLAWHGHTEHVTRLDEPAFSDALTRLLRGNTALVAFITGDGERDPAGKNAGDLGDFVARLGARGIRAVPLNLAEAAEVPRNAALVVLASPQAALLPASARKLTDYVADGGNLLWLTEPGDDDLGLQPLADALGIKRLGGALVDAQGAAAGIADLRTLIATHYPAQPITKGFALNTLFPHAAALAVRSGAAWHADPILQSSARSWTQTTPVESAPAAFDPAAGALKGPLAFGYALDRLSPSPAKNQQRVVVIGDGAFLSNGYLASAGNLALGERVVDWLLGDDALAALPAAAPDTVLKPGQTQLSAITFGYLIVLPIVLILAGLWIQRVRRRR